MPIPNGTSAEMEEAARKCSDEELVEIGFRNDQPPAMKARAEITRRANAFNARMLCWTMFAAVAAAAGALIALAVWVFPDAFR